MVMFVKYCPDGNRRGAVPPDRALLADPAWRCERVQCAGVERDFACGRAGLQMARRAQAIRQLAHHLRSHEPVVEEWRSGSGNGTVGVRSDRPHQDRGRGLGPYGPDVMFMASINFAHLTDGPRIV